MTALLTDVGVGRLELVDDGPWRKVGLGKWTIRISGARLLALEVENFNAGGGSSAEPVTVGGEDEGIDDVASLEGVEVLALVKVPEHGDAVLSARSSEGTIRGDSNSVDVAGVAVVVGLELELGKLPDLEEKVSRRFYRDVDKRGIE